jgi:hypothetical protein
VNNLKDVSPNKFIGCQLNTKKILNTLSHLEMKIQNNQILSVPAVKPTLKGMTLPSVGKEVGILELWTLLRGCETAQPSGKQLASLFNVIQLFHS